MSELPEMIDVTDVEETEETESAFPWPAVAAVAATSLVAVAVAYVLRRRAAKPAPVLVLTDDVNVPIVLDPPTEK